MGPESFFGTTLVTRTFMETIKLVPVNEADLGIITNTALPRICFFLRGTQLTPPPTSPGAQRPPGLVAQRQDPITASGQEAIELAPE